MHTIERFIPDGAAVLLAEHLADKVAAGNTDSPVQVLVESGAYWNNAGNVADGNIEISAVATKIVGATTVLTFEVMSCVDAAKSGAYVAATVNVPAANIPVNFVIDPRSLASQKPTHKFWFLRAVIASEESPSDVAVNFSAFFAPPC